MILDFERENREGHFSIPCAAVAGWRRNGDELTIFIIGGRSFAFYGDEAGEIESKLRDFYETGQKSGRKSPARRSGKSTTPDRGKA